MDLSDVNIPLRHFTYRKNFSDNLLLVVSEIFKPSDELTASKQVGLLYPSELQTMAADAGYKLRLHVNTAVTFLVIMQSSRIKESSRFSSLWSRLGSPKARLVYGAHCRMLENCNGLSAFWDKESVGPFTDELLHQFFAQAKGLPVERLRELRYLLGIPDEPGLGLWSTLPK